MKITFLGTGTSQGIPVIACECSVCISKDKRDKRLRSSIMLEWMQGTVVIDAGPDFRYQMLRNEVKKLNGIILTHEHMDHVGGLDEVRAFNHKMKSSMKVYARLNVKESVMRQYDYVFASKKHLGVPEIDLIEIENKNFEINGLSFTPIEAMHYRLPVFGYRIGDFTYITDAKTISDQEKEKIKGTKVMAINALQKEPHLSHFTLQEAIQISKEINPEQTFLTHIGHRLGLHQEVLGELPPGIDLAYDGLTLFLE